MNFTILDGSGGTIIGDPTAGALISGSLAVTGGQTVLAIAGGSGTQGAIGPPGSSLYGQGGTSSAGSGGGASALLLDGGNLVVVAGAGGGGVSNDFLEDANYTVIGDSVQGNAGSAGESFSIVDLNQVPPAIISFVTGGGAGTAISPGDGGIRGGPEYVGVNGNPSPGSCGGDGVAIIPGFTAGASGGGGGGFFGGGSGAALYREDEFDGNGFQLIAGGGGGGGGSSFLAGFVSDMTENLLASPSGGFVRVTYF